LSYGRMHNRRATAAVRTGGGSYTKPPGTARLAVGSGRASGPRPSDRRRNRAARVGPRRFRTPPSRIR